MQPEITYPINLLVIVISLFLCLTLGTFLFFSKSAKNNANLFLGGLVMVSFPFFFQGFLYRFHLLDNFPYFMGLGIPALFLLGPFAYFYVRTCTQKGYQLQLKEGLHFLPFLGSFLWNIPHFIMPSAWRIARYIDFINDGNLPNHPTWLLLVMSLHGAVYFMVSTRFILQYRKNLSNETSAIDTAFHRWMLLFITLLALPVTSYFFYFQASYHRIFILIHLISFFFLLLAIYGAALIRPQLFHTFPHQMTLSDSPEKQKQKYENSKLQESQKEKYIEKLVAYMKRKKPYLTSDLTLAQLSEQIKIPAHYLSQVINEKLDSNFIDFINGYRVNEAKQKLTNPKFSHYTIISIAYESGFNSKSTFNVVFKKLAGTTPSQYRRNAKVLVP